MADVGSAVFGRGNGNGHCGLRRRRRGYADARGSGGDADADTCADTGARAYPGANYGSDDGSADAATRSYGDASPGGPGANGAADADEAEVHSRGYGDSGADDTAARDGEGAGTAALAGSHSAAHLADYRSVCHRGASESSGPDDGDV